MKQPIELSHGRVDAINEVVWLAKTAPSGYGALQARWKKYETSDTEVWIGPEKISRSWRGREQQDAMLREDACNFSAHLLWIADVLDRFQT